MSVALSFFSSPARRLLVILLPLALFAHDSEAGQLTIYSSAEADTLKTYADQFSAAYPSIKINWVRDSSGVIQARLLGLGENSDIDADVVFAHPAADLVTLGNLGRLLPYNPKGLEKLNIRYRDKTDPAQWVGLYSWASALCVNTNALQKTGIPIPERWGDLTRPALKGNITMPDPSTSGTGLLLVTGWIQMMGEDKAWAYMDKLHENIVLYTRSGSRPCEMAGAGETVVGLSLPARGAKLKRAGAPIDVIVAEDGTGWDMQAAGILKRTDHAGDAKVFMDWAISMAAMESYARNAEVSAMRVRVKKMDFLPANISEKMIKVDFDWRAKEKERILTEWKRRYASKSEPIR